MSIKIASMNFGDCDTILHNTTNGMKNIAEVLGPNGEVYWSSIKEITATPPLSIRSNGTMLLDYIISGNMAQSATPTPTTPIQPSECGERTGNLLPEFYATSGEISGNSYTITKNSIETHNDGSVLGAYYVLAEFRRSGNYANYAIIDEKHSFQIPAGAYTFSGNENIHSSYNGLRLIVGQLGQTMAAGAINVGVGQTFTINADSYVCPVLEIRSDSRVDEYTLTNPMLNSGSAALPYEKFGYKIPISSANITTPIFLGEVPTTRNIRKLVLDGTEEWRIWALPSSYSVERYFINVSGVRTQRGSICSHFLWSPDDTDQEHFRFGGTNLSEFLIFIKKETVATITDFKSYLAAQYAAGTPVCVWYVLAEPETAVVNEPLRKIDDYADTLSYEQAGVQIPTLHGNTVIDVETELKPSQMYIKYK